MRTWGWMQGRLQGWSLAHWLFDAGLTIVLSVVGTALLHAYHRLSALAAVVVFCGLLVGLLLVVTACIVWFATSRCRIGVQSPRVTSFLPDPDLPVATLAELSNAVVENRHVYVAEYVARNNTNAIRKKWFTNCVIHGPAVLVHVEDNRIERCIFKMHQECLPSGMLWVPESEPCIGGIGLIDCKFDDCVFVEIGFSGTQEFRDLLRNMQRMKASDH